MFGVEASFCMLLVALQNHFDQYHKTYEKIVEALKKNMYVNNHMHQVAMWRTLWN